MKICGTHWEELKAAIKAKGLWDLVARSPQEAGKIIEGELEGEKKTKHNFDPLLAANNMIWSNGLKTGGLYLMGTKPDGTEYCPVCEADAHGQTGWIAKAADAAAAVAKELPET